MFYVTIDDRSRDAKVFKLVRDAFESLTPTWRKTLPKLSVHIVEKPFNKIPELTEFCEMQNQQPGWDPGDWSSTQAICPEFDKIAAEFWIYYNKSTIMGNPDYYFKKDIHSVIAKLIWSVSEDFQRQVVLEATGEQQGNGSLAYVAFRDSFSRYFLNPEWLQEKRYSAWALMKKLDEYLRCRKIAE